MKKKKERKTMPSYDYECPAHGIFEEFHSASIKLEHCPQCKELGKDQEIKRLISLGSKGVVEKYGQELVDKIKSDTVQLKKDMHKNEYLYANMLGNDKYEAMQTKLDDQKRIRRK